MGDETDQTLGLGPGLKYGSPASVEHDRNLFSFVSMCRLAYCGVLASRS